MGPVADLERTNERARWRGRRELDRWIRPGPRLRRQGGREEHCRHDDGERNAHGRPWKRVGAHIVSPWVGWFEATHSLVASRPAWAIPSLRAGSGYLGVADGFARGRAAANRAVALDSTLADAHTALGFINLFYDWDWDATRRRLETALRLDPTYGEARLFYAWWLVAIGRPAEAVDSLRAAVRDEPVSLILNARLGTMLMLAGRYQEAERQVGHTTELSANYSPPRLDRAKLLAVRGQFDSAAAIGATVPERVGAYGSGVVGYALARGGRRAEALAEIARLSAGPLTATTSSLGVAQTYGALGDLDRAFQWLERAYQERDWALFFCRYDPLLEPLRGDPRWAAFVARMKYPPA